MIGYYHVTYVVPASIARCQKAEKMSYVRIILPIR